MTKLLKHLVDIPYSFKVEDTGCETPFMVCRWVSQNHYESFFVLYQKQEKEPSLFFPKAQVYKAILIEYVSETWGIQKACLGSWDYVPKILKHLKDKELSFEFKVLDFDKHYRRMKYNLETHEITYYKNYATHISSLPNTWTDEEYKDW